MSNRVSMMFPPREPWTFKTHEDNNRDALATPTKEGRLAISPSHILDKHAKAFCRSDELKPNSAAKSNIIKKLQSAPALPRFVNDVTKAPISDLDNVNNALNQRLDS